MPSLEKSPYRNVKIRIGQRWKDRRTGKVVTVTGRRSGSTWVISQPGTRYSHHASDRTIKIFMELLP